MIEVEASHAGSFTDTLLLCRAAAASNDLAHSVICGQHVFAAPGDDPHRLYKQYFAQKHSQETLRDFWKRTTGW